MPPKPDKTPDTARGSTSTLEAVADVLGSGAVRDVLVFSMVLGLGLSAYSAMFALGAKEAFKIDAQVTLSPSIDFADSMEPQP